MAAGGSEILLAPGETVQLTEPSGFHRTQWRSSNSSVATVSLSGLVTGVSAGVTEIEAKARNQRLTWAVRVEATTTTTLELSRVVVSPGNASIPAGGTVALTATGLDSRGDTVPGLTFTWTSSNTSVATVSSGAVVTGVAGGSATIRAVSEGVEGTASVTVTQSQPGLWRANEPAGMATQMDTGFGDPNWSSFGAFTAQTQQGFADATSPHSPSKVARFHIPGNLTDGHTGAAWVNLPAGTLRVYTAAWVKWSNPGIVHPGNQKMWYYYHGAGSTDGGLVTGFFPGDAPNAIKPNGQPQGGSPGVMEPAGNDPRLPVKGEWFLIETLAVMNTSSQSNGIYRTWLNGELLVNNSNVLYRSAATPWRECNLNWYFGGGPTSTRAYDTYIDVDHAYVSSSTSRN
jgi:hypothetical protein